MSTVLKWVNTEPDEAAPHALLDRLAQQIPAAIIDEIWLFPTRRAGGVESSVFVVTAYGEDPERRRVVTAHFSVTRDKKGRAQVQQHIEEHALAPAAALGRVVDGVLRRLGDEIAHAPRAERIDRDPACWQALRLDLGAPVDRTDSGSADGGEAAASPTAEHRSRGEQADRTESERAAAAEAAARSESDRTVTGEGAARSESEYAATAEAAARSEFDQTVTGDRGDGFGVEPPADDVPTEQA